MKFQITSLLNHFLNYIDANRGQNEKKIMKLEGLNWNL